MGRCIAIDLVGMSDRQERGEGGREKARDGEGGQERAREATRWRAGCVMIMKRYVPLCWEKLGSGGMDWVNVWWRSRTGVKMALRV